MAMRLPRYQFTIRRLILLIAGCAVVLALLRTPFGFLVVAFGFVLPGFLIERARGGSGVLGGGLSASLIAGGLVIAGFYFCFTFGPNLGNALLEFVGFLYIVSLFAFICGTILSSMLYAIFTLPRAILKRPLRDESCGSIHWRRLNDREPAGR